MTAMPGPAGILPGPASNMDSKCEVKAPDS
jgi:hypothetical protein